MSQEQGISEELISKIRRIFAILDKDKSGTIDSEELGSMFQQLGQPKTEEELKELISVVDEKNTGQIDFDALVKLFTIDI
jgi:Ca2+-binding EF-hand superfamily protein